MAYTPPPSNPGQPPSRKHSLHYILSPAELALDAPDVPNVTTPTSRSVELPAETSPHTRQSHLRTRTSSPSQTTTPHAASYNRSNGTSQLADSPRSNGAAATTTVPAPTRKPSSSSRRGRLTALPPNVLAQIALDMVVDDDGVAGGPYLFLPLLYTCRTTYEALNFDANPVLYNRLFRATFDLGALVRRTQWMFDQKTDVPGTSKKTELFANPRSWATEYRDRWRLRYHMRASIKYNSINVPGVTSVADLDTDIWALWFLWTENDVKNFKFLTEECRFHQWILIMYKDTMLVDTLKLGYPKDTPLKALAHWLAMYSGSDLFAERSPAEVDEKIFMLRPYVFACFKYEMTYADWHHKRLPLCKPGCKDHPPIAAYTAPYTRFGHVHRRAPPHIVLGSYLCFLRLLERQPCRIGMKAEGNTTFLDDVHPGHGLYSVTQIMPSPYHDPEWQRNTVCQDPHSSPGLPPLTFHGRLEGYWRGNLLFFDFEAYRAMLAGNMPPVYTSTFARHAVEMEVHETVIRVREEDVGGAGSRLHAGYPEHETEEDQERIRSGYGHEVLTGEQLREPDPPGYTKEILLSGTMVCSWGASRMRGRVRAWDGLVTISIGDATPHPMGMWIWRGYIHTGGHLLGRWRDTFTPETKHGYEGPLGLIRAGDIFYPPHWPRTLAASPGMDKLDLSPSGSAPGPAPFGVDHRPDQRMSPRDRITTTGGVPSPVSRSSSDDDPMEGSATPGGASRKRSAASMDYDDARKRRPSSATSRNGSIDVRMASRGNSTFSTSDARSVSTDVRMPSRGSSGDSNRCMSPEESAPRR